MTRWFWRPLVLSLCLISPPAGADAPLSAYLDAVPGLAADGPGQTADGAEALFAAINGGAERFIRSGFRRAWIGTRRADGGRLNVGLYEMTDPAAAGAVFKDGAGPETTAVAVGDRAALADYYLIFTAGPFYVSLTAFDDGPENRKTLIRIGRALAEELPVSPKGDH